MEGQGTAWSIFSAYAEMKGYNCQEIGDIETVAAFLKEGHPVIISVKPGYFTTTGHIMVMSGVDEKAISGLMIQTIQKKGPFKTDIYSRRSDE